MAECLYRLALQDPLPADLAQRVQLGAQNIITAMGEQREHTTIFHSAPAAQDLPATVVPDVVPGKRSRGLIAAREPIPYDARYAPGASMPYEAIFGSASYQGQTDIGCTGTGPSYLDVGGSSSHYVSAPPQLQPSEPAPACLTPVSTQGQFDFSSLFSDQPAYGTDYGMQFLTPDHPIPSVHSPVLDLNTSPSVHHMEAGEVDEEGDDEEGDEADQDQDQDQGRRRSKRPITRRRCGTGSHYV